MVPSGRLMVRWRSGRRVSFEPPSWIAWMLLWCVKGRFECSEDFAADVALEAAADFTFGFAFRSAPCGVGLGAVVVTEPLEAHNM